MTTTLTGIAAFPRLSEATTHLRQGRYDAAAAQVIQHLREHRNEPRGIALLGSIALKTGALIQAEQFLRQAMALGAATLEVQTDLASALNLQDRLGDALIAFTHLESQVSDPQIRAKKGAILEKLGRHSEALEIRESLIRQHPGEPAFWFAYAHSLRAVGKIDEAVAAYRQATKIDPERGEAWWGLASIKSKVFTDEDIATMESALGEAVDLLNVVPLHIALGRAWHDRKDYERAFRHYSDGNRLSREAMKYRREDLSEEVDEFIRLFGKEFFEQTASPTTSTGPIPVFLISMPRSGSTLLEQMLDQHPDIEALGELPYVRALLRSALEIHTRRGSIKVPRLLQSLSPDERRAFGEDYLNRAGLHRKGDSRYILDKMPMNWSDVLFIRQILPQAKFIEIRRNAMDCCFSNFIHYFSRAHSSSFDLGDLGQSYVDYVRLMNHLNEAAPGLIHCVRYETLVEDPEPQLRAVFNYLDLPWDDAALRFYESSRPVRTPSAEQVRRPLNREGIRAWEPYAQWLGPLREALGPLADA
jgi:tetratricopeptide (TPR) repeat protein